MVHGGTREEQREGVRVLQGLLDLPRNTYGSGDLGWALGVVGNREGAMKELERARDAAENGSRIRPVVRARARGAR